MSDTSTDLLAALVERKHGCLVQLREMGRRQWDSVVAGSMTDLLDILAAKQRVLGDLQRVERGLEPFQGQEPETRRWRSPAERQACAGRLAECQMLLREILEQERESERELVRRRDEASAQLQGMHAARAARGAYAQPLAEPFRQLDLTSDR